jgi:hypothetical protein
LTTAVVSDIHLGARTRMDVLRRPEVRERLLAALEGVRRLVILGDSIELRHGPLRDILGHARPFFEALSETVDEVLLVPGNHDHTLLHDWFESRRADGEPPPLGLEQRIAPDAGEGTARIAEWLAPARFELAYPGAWLRSDVYALHGHYVDCHLTIPTFERLAVAAMQRLVARSAVNGTGGADTYEAALEPLYDWIYAVAQHERRDSAAAGGAQLSAGVWKRLNGEGPASRLAWAAIVPAFVTVANRAGLGPFRADLSGSELRRAGLRAIGDVAERMDVTATHLLFGHTHRAGPLAGDDAAEWTGPRGVRIVNTGSWIYARHFLTPRPNESPYWPGVIVRLDDGGPPRIERLLGDLGHAELRPPLG